MLLTTTTFFFSSLLPLLQPLYCSWFFLQIFRSVHVCGKDVAFVSIVTTTASCKLITTGFVVFVVHRVIESSLLLLVFCSRTEMWRRKRRRSCRSSSSLNAGIFTIHRRSTMLSYESYQTTNVEIRENEITIHSCLHTKNFLLHFQSTAY